MYLTRIPFSGDISLMRPTIQSCPNSVDFELRSSLVSLFSNVGISFTFSEISLNTFYYNRIVRCTYQNRACCANIDEFSNSPLLVDKLVCFLRLLYYSYFFKFRIGIFSLLVWHTKYLTSLTN